jgi:methionyl-tRNA formyltransferase
MNINLNECRLIFAGTPHFSLPSLVALLELDISPIAVITQPDRRAGRGKQLTKSPVKVFAEEQNLEVWQPLSLSDSQFIKNIKSIKPDIVVVAAYGSIFPEKILNLPKFGCVNVHASLLPRWRGASPIQSAILHGDNETGISLMKMEIGLDTGPIFTQHKIDIERTETADKLNMRLAKLGGMALKSDFESILNGHIPSNEQDQHGMILTKKVKKSDAKINWNQPADYISRHIRAYNSSPGAYFNLENEMIKCWSADYTNKESGESGKVIHAGESGIEVACLQGTLIIKILQRPGRNKVTAAEFCRQINLKNLQLT